MLKFIPDEIMLNIKLFFKSFKKQPDNATYFDEKNKCYIKCVCMNMDGDFDVMEYKSTSLFSLRYQWKVSYRDNLNSLTSLNPIT